MAGRKIYNDYMKKRGGKIKVSLGFKKDKVNIKKNKFMLIMFDMKSGHTQKYS